MLQGMRRRWMQNCYQRAILCYDRYIQSDSFPLNTVTPISNERSVIVCSTAKSSKTRYWWNSRKTGRSKLKFLWEPHKGPLWYVELTGDDIRRKWGDAPAVLASEANGCAKYMVCESKWAKSDASIETAILQCWSTESNSRNTNVEKSLCAKRPKQQKTMLIEDRRRVTLMILPQRRTSKILNLCKGRILYSIFKYEQLEEDILRLLWTRTTMSGKVGNEWA